MSTRCGNVENKVFKEVDSALLAGLIKDNAWSYEKEIRLRVDLQEKIPYKKVAVRIPDEIIQSIITMGPRFDKKHILQDFSGVAEVMDSMFFKKLNYVYCDRCRSSFL